MRGFVPTPEPVVDLMIEKLFRGGAPSPNARILDPGCGPGAFIDGVLRWAARRKASVPRIVGVELDPLHVARARERFKGHPSVEIRRADFLTERLDGFDYVIGNPPYVPITSLSESEREVYRAEFHSAKGRFDLYLLFLEQSLRALKVGGRLVFITPEKFTYVETARPLRALLKRVTVEELHFLDEATFPGLVTYPLVTTLDTSSDKGRTSVINREGLGIVVDLPTTGVSWQPTLRGAEQHAGDIVLASVTTRISCGVATGADGVFVLKSSSIPPELRRYAYATVSGKGLSDDAVAAPTHRMLIPYRRDGALIEEGGLAALGKYLRSEGRRALLEERTCVSRKPWYAFHETPQLRSMLRPKILCKDIAETAHFIADREGKIVPRHSVYYVVPRPGVDLDLLLQYLNSETAQHWFSSHCQRAANGYLRLQSTILKRLPVPRSLLEGPMSDSSRRIAS